MHVKFFYLVPAVTTTLEVISQGSARGWNAESCRLAEISREFVNMLGKVSISYSIHGS